MPGPEYIVSACLAGELCRWDGTSKPNPEVVEMVKTGRAAAFCPEVLGNLGVPRPKAEIRGGDGGNVISGEARVINEENRDVTEAFLTGAESFLSEARKLGINKALLKENSPSCGVKRVYRNGELVNGPGVTTALLLRNGFQAEGIE